MRHSETPFSPQWMGTGLESAGLGPVRPDVGTYGTYSFAALPDLPFVLTGDFCWLSWSEPREESIGSERADENSTSLVTLGREASRLGLALPRPFLTFMNDLSLQRRVRSNTDCFLDLCSSPIPSPIGDGFLIRFLADSQGCLFWYLYLRPNGHDHAVVASPGFYGTPEEEWQDDEADPSDIVFCSESFEAFMCRFWIENELWFSGNDGVDPASALVTYANSYLRGST